MPWNLTIWKINNFFLILYGEISVLIGPIPRLFVTGAFHIRTTFIFIIRTELTLHIRSTLRCPLCISVSLNKIVIWKRNTCVFRVYSISKIIRNFTYYFHNVDFMFLTKSRRICGNLKNLNVPILHAGPLSSVQHMQVSNEDNGLFDYHR